MASRQRFRLWISCCEMACKKGWCRRSGAHELRRIASMLHIAAAATEDKDHAAAAAAAASTEVSRDGKGAEGCH